MQNLNLVLQCGPSEKLTRSITASWDPGPPGYRGPDANPSTSKLTNPLNTIGEMTHFLKFIPNTQCWVYGVYPHTVCMTPISPGAFSGSECLCSAEFVPQPKDRFGDVLRSEEGIIANRKKGFFLSNLEQLRKSGLLFDTER